MIEKKIPHCEYCDEEGNIVIKNPSNYEWIMFKHGVIASHELRRDLIILQQAALKLHILQGKKYEGDDIYMELLETSEDENEFKINKNKIIQLAKEIKEI
jgi:hypothetical protein